MGCLAKRGRPGKTEKKGSNQSDTTRKKRGRPSLRIEAQDLPAPSSIPQNDIDSNLDDRSSTVRALKKGNGLSKDVTEHTSMSLFIPPDPKPQDLSQSTQEQYGPIIGNLKKQSVREERLDDPMSPLSPCTETSTHASPTRSTISLQAGSITVSRARHFMFW